MSSSTTATISGYYQSIQFRNAPTATLESFSSLVSSGGMTLAQVRQAIIDDAHTTNFVDPVMRLYQAAFGRVPENGGALDFYADRLADGRMDLISISRAFVASPEFQARYGTDATPNAATITALYLNVLGRAPDQAGFQFYQSNGMSTAQMLQAFSQSPEFQTRSNAAVDAFLNANALGTAVFSGPLQITVPGQTFVLTTGLDSGAAFTGGAGNDIFNASNAAGTAAGQTLTAGDTLEGGAGTDTLNATIAANVTLSNVSGIENVNVTALAGALTTNLLGSSGVTSVTSNGSTHATTFSNIGSTGVGLSVRNSDVGATFEFAAAAVAGTADTATLTISNQTAGTNVIAGVETLNVVSTGGANALTALTAAAASTIVISGDTTLNLGAENTVARTISSVNTAGVTLTSNVAGGLGVTISGGDGNDAITLTEGAAASNNVSGGAGNDTVTFTANLDTADTVAGGAGNDTLVAASADAIDTYTRISGFEVLQVSNALGGALNTANLQAGIERVNLMAGTGGNTVTFEAGAKTLGLHADVAAAVVVVDTGSATTDSLTILNTSAATDVLNTQALTVTGFETVTFNGSTTTAGAASQDFGAITITPDAGGSVTLNFTGNNSVTAGTITASTATAGVVSAAGLTGTATFTNTGAAGITSITGSANGDTIVGSATATTVSGGAGNDNITGGAAADNLSGDAGNDVIDGAAGNDVLSGGEGNDSITAGDGNDNVQGGAGNDTLTFGAHLAAGDVIDGGDGTDVLSITDASVNAVNGLTISQVIALNNNISGIERVTISTALDRGLDVARLDGIETITLAAGINGSETLSGFTATGGNVTISHASNNAADELTLSVSTDSAADAFTVNLTNNADTDFSEVTLNDIETLNIVTAQATAAAALVTATFDVNANVTNNTIGLTTLNISGTESLNLSGTAINATNVVATGLTSTGTGTTAALNFVGGNRANTITLGGGADTVDAGAGNDTVAGGGGADSLTGGTGEDSLSGDGGNDTLIGGADNDTLTGGEGVDNIRGGTGNDSIILSEATSVADTVVIAAVATTGAAASDSGRATVTGLNNDTGADTVTGMTWGTDVIQIEATAVAGFVHGTNTFVGTAVGDLNDGTAGSFLTTVGLVNLDASDLVIGAGDVAITFASPSAALTEARFEAALQYNLTGDANGNSITTGGLADTIDGGDGADTIVAGAGNDRITGGLAADTLTGGDGVDTFVFAGTLNGTDTITDFTVGAAGDALNLDAALAAGATVHNSVVGGLFVSPDAAALALETTAIGVSNQLIIINSGALATTGYDDAAEVVTLLANTGAWDAVDFAASATGYILAAANNGTTALLWQVTNDATAAVIAGELALVGTITIAADGIDALHANNFVLV